MVRSPDASTTRLDRVLEVLEEAGLALTAHSSLPDALEEVAQSVVRGLADRCEIEVDHRHPGQHGFRLAAGERAEGEAGDSIVESLGDGRSTFGTIACHTASALGFDDAARKAVRVLATQIGLVISGQAIAQRGHRVADRLQRALLPEHLPEIPGAKFYAAYRPASDEAEVGGDWFDAFHLPDRRVALSVGDVAGHGLEAAVIMSEIRQAIRTAAVEAASPASVLDHVNRIIGLRESHDMVTAIIGFYDPVSSVLSYAAAGHPPPLFALGNGLVRLLPSGTLPLGCAASINSRDWTVTLPAGAQIVFYTDGLTENERDVIGGERRLADAVKRLAIDFGSSAENVADPALALQERIFKDLANRDDAALLILSRNAPVSPYIFSAVSAAAPIARAIIGDELELLGVDEARRFGVLVAVGEAVANTIEHAYREDDPGLIRLETAHDDGTFAITIEDFGHWRPFVRRQERGRGFELMHAFMDGVRIQSTNESTRIVMKIHVGSKED
jgi:serine phosphatase RsbU (regulator of sigma subunit)/anti-sigma regulatory factor (Ser/Thr protein kinase)